MKLAFGGEGEIHLARPVPQCDSLTTSFYLQIAVRLRHNT